VVAAAAAVPVLAAAGVIALIVTAATASAGVGGDSSGGPAGVGLAGPAACMPGPAVVPAAGLSAQQMGNATVIASVATVRGLGRSGAVIGVMTALTESSLIDVDHGDALGPDSRGLFQQRGPWGPLSVRMDPAGSAGLFFDALVRVRGWQVLPPWVAAQAVQHSEFTDGANYRANYPRAVTAVGAILGPAGTTDPGAARLGCEPGPTGAGNVSNGVSNGAWGGYANGLIPASALCPLSSAGQLLRCDAAAAWDAMAAAYLADTGEALCITDSYRPLSVQQELRAEKPDLAAVPGTSNHGWGLAVDMCEPGAKPMGYTTPTYVWLKVNASRFGWTHPGWADPGRGQEEPWHWEYTGTGS
jgi:hypothetical protein